MAFRLWVAALCVAIGIGGASGGQIWTAAEKSPAEAEASARQPSSVRLVRVGQIPGKVNDGSFEVAVQEKYVYLASGNLYVLDVSRPAEPKEVGFYETEQDPCNVAWRVAVAGEYVFVAGGGEQGFSILRAHWAHQPDAPPPKP